jgi:hypothetical protein
MRPRLISLAVVLFLGAALSAADPPPPAPARPEGTAPDVEALIRQLGDPSFELRQAASEKLTDRPEAIPALRKALKSDDPEVARRAEAVLAALLRRGEKQALARLEELAKGGEVDQAIELLVRRPEWVEEAAAWQVMTGLAETLANRGAREFGANAVPPPGDGLPAGDFRTYVEKCRPKMQVTGRVEHKFVRRHKVVVRAEEIEAGYSTRDLFVAAGPLRSGTDNLTHHCYLTTCVVLSGGSVAVENASGSLVVCDGDFTASTISKCLIVARGDVRVVHARDCRIIASGSVQFGTSTGNKNTDVKEKQANPLGFVKWFDPASVGVVVEKAEGGVKVKQADEGKPFARAGLRAGDLVVSADAKTIDSPETFRRLLRARVVMGDEMTLEVRRDGKPVKLTVDLSPPEPPKK